MVRETPSDGGRKQRPRIAPPSSIDRNRIGTDQHSLNLTETRRRPVEELTLEELSANFHLPINDVARKVRRNFNRATLSPPNVMSRGTRTID